MIAGRANLKLVPDPVPFEPETAVEVFMHRDGMTEEEAIEHAGEIKREIFDAAAQPDMRFSDIEDILLGEGLELDYFDEFI